MTFETSLPRAQHQQAVRGFARGRDDGFRIDLPNWSMLVKVTAGDTLGRVTVLEGRMGPRLAGPAAHVHDGHDETFVVLEGRMRFRVGDGFHTAVPGETVFASRRLAHGFSNPFDESARYVAILTPSGYEEYFASVAEHVARTGVMPDEDRTRELMAQHQTVLAPKLSDPGTDLPR
ncbi:cupin domain-containing protein [Frankia sp. Cr2]|uniref:cupin domain-containing protein n=1 Tax=Frankia sp. Cr2 TaxID=3073932 RepID=UPI002AD2103C|nr:cupin domain-containing protein [Frankia sp. Cr2]